MRWRVYYADGSVVTGTSRRDWVRAPVDAVQVVVLMEPYPDVDGQPYRPWAGVGDRQIWTGEDEYDPFGWGVKHGSLIADAAYFRIFDRARTD